MPRTKNKSVQRNHWGLAVLALLREREMHPYEMRRLMRERHKEERLVLKSGSLYNAIEWLEKDRLIKAVRTSRQGKRPQRTVYRITSAGEAELLKWLREFISMPVREPSTFAVALDHFIHLSPADAATQIEARIKRLEPQVEQMAGMVKMLTPKIGRINLLEIEFEKALVHAEIRWLQELLGDIRSGALAWDINQILEYLRKFAHHL
jgi:DNA-binding PadR family transcriptional regulator